MLKRFVTRYPFTIGLGATAWGFGIVLGLVTGLPFEWLCVPAAMIGAVIDYARRP